MRGKPFGTTSDGEIASLFTLENPRLLVRITDYGGRIVGIEAPDGRGVREDVVLGFDDAQTYAEAGGAFGALLGRNANRIADAELTIDGRSYKLSTNDRGNTLHGGERGFDKLLWRVAAASDRELALALVSPGGDQGFPGELSVEARYRIDDATLSLDFIARTSEPTVVSLSAHPYFNLAGAAAGDILGHEVTIAAGNFLPTDGRQIPTGEIRPVDGTIFDFRTPMPVGARIRHADPQLLYGLGYDHCYALDRSGVASARFAARARDPVSGRTVEIHTTQPAMQFYAGNKLNGSVVGRGGVIYRQSAGLAFEPQGFPDAPHHPNFPSTVLRPGEVYRQIIEYRFGAG